MDHKRVAFILINYHKQIVLESVSKIIEYKHDKNVEQDETYQQVGKLFSLSFINLWSVKEYIKEYALIPDKVMENMYTLWDEITPDKHKKAFLPATRHQVPPIQPIAFHSHSQQRSLVMLPIYLE